MAALLPWSPAQFEQYVAIALDTMVREGVVATDATGHADCIVRPAGRLAEGSLRIEAVANLSGIGLPAGVPLSATTQPDGSVAWYLGDTAIRTVPATWTPEEAGEGLGVNLLRVAQRCSMERNQIGGRNR